MGALQQVVAQDQILRETPRKGLAEGVHIVNALADERTLPEEVLVHVGDLARIGVQPDLSAGQPRIPAAVRGLQPDRHARLQDRVSLHDSPERGVEARTAERMRHRTDHLRGRSARQIGVGVERDDIPDAARRRHLPDNRRERRLRLTAQEGVELLELAALALVAHPEAIIGVPYPGPVQ